MFFVFRMVLMEFGCFEIILRLLRDLGCVSRVFKCIL